MMGAFYNKRRAVQARAGLFWTEKEMVRSRRRSGRPLRDGLPDALRFGLNVDLEAHSFQASISGAFSSA
jgi:hypothetical protein